MVGDPRWPYVADNANACANRAACSENGGARVGVGSGDDSENSTRVLMIRPCGHRPAGSYARPRQPPQRSSLREIVSQPNVDEYGSACGMRRRGSKEAGLERAKRDGDIRCDVRSYDLAGVWIDAARKVNGYDGHPSGDGVNQRVCWASEPAIATIPNYAVDDEVCSGQRIERRLAAFVRERVEDAST
ncbi:hypothetical protein Asi02nite_37570 [Asanoa siamensis]|uniref:Uncharacterized protein n=1 Tax=Asanoa siamensis TaxID=926357 RepID=A0ABQ4CSI4_9ACTN|nr:hypothetical protein Asi02nite_37570 [Asanoa siamensis]